MLLRRFSVAFEKCYLGDFSFARSWVLPSCTLFFPLFWVFCFIDIWQVFLFLKLNKLLWINFFSVLSLLIVIFGSVLLPPIATCATFLRKKKQKLQKTENTESLPPATVGKRVENEERLATMFTHATHADTFVRSQQLRYTPKGHVGNVFGAFRFKSIYLEEIQAPNACNPQFMCV